MKTVLNIIKRYLELKREEVENRYKTFRILRKRPITRNKRKHIKPNEHRTN